MEDDEFTGTYTSDDMVKEYVYKVVVVGNYSVGKTTLVRRLMAAHLPPGAPQDPVEDIRVSPTVGTDFFSHVVQDVTPGQNVRLQIWDTAGLERYATVHESTYRNASLVLCVFDVTDMHTLEDLMERHLTLASDFIPNLDQQNLVFIGNKLDLLQRGPDDTDAATRQEALVANARRAASPEAAFVGNPSRQTSSASFSSKTGGGGGGHADEDENEPVDLEAIVTVADLQSQVFSILPDANYVEVSAKTGEGIPQALDRICKAALFNDHALPAGWDPLTDSHVSFNKSALPQNRVLLRAAGLFREAGQPMPDTRTTVPATTRPTASSDGSPLGSPEDLEDTAVPDERLKKPATTAHAASPKTVSAATATPSTATTSWRQSGAFSFDMAPPNHFNSTMNFSSDAFSPVEGGDAVGDASGDGVRPSSVPAPTTAPAASAPATRARPAPAATASTLSPEQRRLLRTPLSQLTPQEREARRALEHEEMKSMLVRGNDKKPTPADQENGAAVTPSATTGTASASPLGAGRAGQAFTDLDADAGVRVGGGGAAVDADRGKPFRSILDDEMDRKAAERAADEPGESDDEQAFRDRMRSRMDEIDKDAALKKIEVKRSKDREKADKKKKSKGDKAVKADGKCGACQCS